MPALSARPTGTALRAATVMRTSHLASVSSQRTSDQPTQERTTPNPASERVEPRPGELPPAPHADMRGPEAPATKDKGARFPTPDYDELRKLTMLYGEANASAPRPAHGIMRMVAVFAVGAMVGVAAAWWMGTSGTRSATAAYQRTPVSNLPAQKPGERQRVSALKGISPSELPYDGARPAPAERAAPAPTMKGSELPYDGAQAPHSMSGKAADDIKPPRAAAPRKKDAPPPAIRDARRADPPMVSAIKEVEPAAERKSARSTQSQRGSQRSAKDKEIDRITRQAADELKKKTENKGGAGETRQASRASSERAGKPAAASSATSGKSVRIRAMLAQCERASNFILREQCRWRLCGNMWGKHGCPSYAPHASSSFLNGASK